MPPPPPASLSTGRSVARRDQLIALALAAAFLVASLFLQPKISTLRNGTRDPDTGKTLTQGLIPTTDTSAKQLGTQLTALTLGGFRGIIAQQLWDRAEAAKNDRRWEELGTDYALIAKLEPFFVSVYVFNAWNQAYNLSAQWHSVHNKYRWVLEGLNYLYEGEYYNPRNPDILNEISQMYFMKLGNSFERTQYREFWRDNITHQYEVALPGTPATTKDEAHDLVRNFILRPQFRTELIIDGPPENRRAGYGIRIRGLIKNKPDEPLDFRYGVSVFYFSYIEYQRALLAGKPTIGNIRVIDAYPAMSLRKWCMDDAYYASTQMRDLFVPNPDDKSPPLADLHTADAQGKFDAKVLEIRDCFRNINDIAGPAADAEFAAHLIRYPENKNTHTKHKLETQFVVAIARAEHTLFEGLILWQQKGRKTTDPDVDALLRKSLGLYDDAIASLNYYLDQVYRPNADGTPNPDRKDYSKYIPPLQLRQEGIKTWLTAGDSHPPDLSFLHTETIER